ncbi:hypothetical protein ACFL3M_01555 [Patescibacteria group bacterium]
MSILNQVLYDFSNYFVTEWAIEYPRMFTLIFFTLVLSCAWITIERLRLYWRLRISVLERIIETKRQAMAHQHNKHPVEHALEPHKQQKSDYIEELSVKLWKFDPLRKDIENFISDLRAAPSFEKSEEISALLLKKYKKI